MNNRHNESTIRQLRRHDRVRSNGLPGRAAPVIDASDAAPGPVATSQGSMRVLGIAEGSGPFAQSGAPHYLFSALEKRFPVTRLSYSPTGLRQLALAAATVRPSRPAWRARFHTSRRAHRARSKTLAERVGEVDGQFDLVLQVHGWVSGQPRPYALYVDQTRLMAERGWPSWMPIEPGEREEILALERDMYKDAFHVFVFGNPARESLLSDYGVDAARVTVVGGGANYETLPTPSELSASPNILFVGRDFERKGGDCLIEAFQMVRGEVADARLHIIGVGNDFGVPGVISHGKIFDRKGLEGHYRRARVFCQPSRFDLWPLALAEAMAVGVPCVGTTVGSIPEILDGGKTGLLVPPDDPAALAEALLRVLTDDGLARTLGAAGRQRVEQELTWDRVADRMAPVLSQVRSVER
jgi:glycosyltransferase involved in cell wall biosynthesis